MKAYPLSNMAGLNQQGMDLRDYFAAKIMQSLAMNFENDPDWNAYEQADIAYQIAEAMMEVRKGKNENC